MRKEKVISFLYGFKSVWSEHDELTMIGKRQPADREGQGNKAVYTAELVACDWAGAVK